jgi:hypothetical protein
VEEEKVLWRGSRGEAAGEAALEVVVLRPHAGGSMVMVGRLNEQGMALATGSSWSDPAALFRGAQLAGLPDGPRKGGLKKAYTHNTRTSQPRLVRSSFSR